MVAVVVFSIVIVVVVVVLRHDVLIYLFVVVIVVVVVCVARWANMLHRGLLLFSLPAHSSDMQAGHNTSSSYTISRDHD